MMIKMKTKKKIIYEICLLNNPDMNENYSTYSDTYSLYKTLFNIISYDTINFSDKIYNIIIIKKTIIFDDSGNYAWVESI